MYESQGEKGETSMPDLRQAARGRLARYRVTLSCVCGAAFPSRVSNYPIDRDVRHVFWLFRSNRKKRFDAICSNSGEGAQSDDYGRMLKGRNVCDCRTPHG